MRCDDLFVYPQERGLQDELNVIIFSDHGMTDIFWMDKVIELNKYISLDDLQQVKDRGPVVSLWPAPGKHSEARGTETGPGWGGSVGERAKHALIRHHSVLDLCPVAAGRPPSRFHAPMSLFSLL